MNQPSFDPSRFFLKACCFEASLALVAIILGGLAGVDPFADLSYSEPALVYGLVGTVPPLLLFYLAEYWQSPAFQRIRRLLLDVLGPALQRRHWTDLLLLAAIAGWSEELLFRGVLQPWLEDAWGARFGFVASNLLFALAHAITPLYTVLAFAIGAYLSLAMDYGGARNLLIPVVIHAMYDFWVLVVLVKAYRARQA